MAPWQGWNQDMRQPGKNGDSGWFAQPVLRRPAERAPLSMTAKAMSELRADILAVRLLPDAELPLKILSYRYDVGLTPLREALTLLSGVGLVVHDRRGFRVAPTSRAEFSDIAACRRRLEGMALTLAIGGAGLQWRRRLGEAREALAAVHARVGANEPIDETWEERHRAFHFALIDCGSPVLLDFCRQLHDRFDRYRRLAIANKALMADIGSDHDRIMACALSGDAERAVDLLDRHIAATAELVLENYATADGTLHR